MPVPMSGMPLPGALIKPKRKQVKMAVRRMLLQEVLYVT